ncbi:hypothetical protein [Streptomyces sp. VB1]|uniref:hypothetical protein n=1 Tax=Streptomyces sp. VB1 TaxID=2986803 RepID=UPI00224297E2|nr:hypothetical protein [Streptomyces sp. VB1]UZI30229.1 hypothetical protein OH133_20045 [Streptomyces sp. VB1]
MLWHAIAPSRRYTKASHDVVRHPRLCSDAKVLILYVQGLPDGGTDLALSEHARKLGIKGRAYQRAKMELVMCGFVHERKVRGERGHWATQQVFANVPLAEAEVLGLWCDAGIDAGDASPPSARFPTVGQPRGRAVGHQLPVDEEREKNSSHPPTEAPDANAAQVVEPLLTAEEVEAERVLLSLRHTSHGLRLGVAEARSLLAQTVEWLRRGVSGGELRRVLSSDLPQGGVRCAVGFLRHRLEQKLPEAVVSVPAVEPVRPPSDPPPPSPPAVSQYVAPLVTCAGPGTEHVFRAMAEETECPDCQQAAAWARWAERRAADLGVDLADDAAAAVEAGRDPDGWRGRLAAAAAAAGLPGGAGAADGSRTVCEQARSGLRSEPVRGA